jgi:hypothetical protein
MAPERGKCCHLVEMDQDEVLPEVDLQSLQLVAKLQKKSHL